MKIDIKKLVKKAWLYITSSKTIMFNVMIGAAGAIQLYSGLLRDLFKSDSDFGIFMVIVATIGTYLRVVTNKSLSEKVKEKEAAEHDA
jgi:uncharacterized membrane protein YeaQ/YmgE (transglycosylase-associated protein family)